MEDFNALASSLALGGGDVRGCLILSRDGLVLGAHPVDAESSTTPAWVRFATIGDPERGFAQFGTESWCYVRRGPYAGFAVLGPGERPGLMIDHMDQALLVAEEGRSRHEGPRGVEGTGLAPVSKPRSHLHPEHRAPDPFLMDGPSPVVVRSLSGETTDGLPAQPSGDELGAVTAGDGSGASEMPRDPFDELLAWEAEDGVADHAEDGIDAEHASPSGDGPEAQPEPGSPVEEAQGPEHDPDGRPGDPEREPETGSELEPVGQLEHEPNEAADRPADEAAGPGADPSSDHGSDPVGGAGDIDRFSLAREFGQLLQGGGDPADG